MVKRFTPPASILLALSLTAVACGGGAPDEASIDGAADPATESAAENFELGPIGAETGDGVSVEAPATEVGDAATVEPEDDGGLTFDFSDVTLDDINGTESDPAAEPSDEPGETVPFVEPEDDTTANPAPTPTPAPTPDPADEPEIVTTTPAQFPLPTSPPQELPETGDPRFGTPFASWSDLGNLIDVEFQCFHGTIEAAVGGASALEVQVAEGATLETVNLILDAVEICVGLDEWSTRIFHAAAFEDHDIAGIRCAMAATEQDLLRNALLVYVSDNAIDMPFFIAFAGEIEGCFPADEAEAVLATLGF